MAPPPEERILEWCVAIANGEMLPEVLDADDVHHITNLITKKYLTRTISQCPAFAHWNTREMKALQDSIGHDTVMECGLDFKGTIQRALRDLPFQGVRSLKMGTVPPAPEHAGKQRREMLKKLLKGVGQRSEEPGPRMGASSSGSPPSLSDEKPTGDSVAREGVTPPADKDGPSRGTAQEQGTIVEWPGALKGSMTHKGGLWSGGERTPPGTTVGSHQATMTTEKGATASSPQDQDETTAHTIEQALQIAEGALDPTTIKKEERDSIILWLAHQLDNELQAKLTEQMKREDHYEVAGIFLAALQDFFEQFDQDPGATLQRAFQLLAFPVKPKIDLHQVPPYPRDSFRLVEDSLKNLQKEDIAFWKYTAVVDELSTAPQVAMSGQRPRTQTSSTSTTGMGDTWRPIQVDNRALMKKDFLEESSEGYRSEEEPPLPEELLDQQRGAKGDTDSEVAALTRSLGELGADPNTTGSSAEEPPRRYDLRSQKERLPRPEVETGGRTDAESTLPSVFGSTSTEPEEEEDWGESNDLHPYEIRHPEQYADYKEMHQLKEITICIKMLVQPAAEVPDGVHRQGQPEDGTSSTGPTDQTTTESDEKTEDPSNVTVRKYLDNERNLKAKKIAQKKKRTIATMSTATPTVKKAKKTPQKQRSEKRGEKRGGPRGEESAEAKGGKKTPRLTSQSQQTENLVNQTRPRSVLSRESGRLSSLSSGSFGRPITPRPRGDDRMHPIFLRFSEPIAWGRPWDLDDEDVLNPNLSLEPVTELSWNENQAAATTNHYWICIGNITDRRETNSQLVPVPAFRPPKYRTTETLSSRATMSPTRQPDTARQRQELVTSATSAFHIPMEGVGDRVIAMMTLSNVTVKEDQATALRYSSESVLDIANCYGRQLFHDSEYPSDKAKSIRNNFTRSSTVWRLSNIADICKNQKAGLWKSASTKAGRMTTDMVFAAEVERLQRAIEDKDEELHIIAANGLFCPKVAAFLTGPTLVQEPVRHLGFREEFYTQVTRKLCSLLLSSGNTLDPRVDSEHTHVALTEAGRIHHTLNPSNLRVLLRPTHALHPFNPCVFVHLGTGYHCMAQALLAAQTTYAISISGRESEGLEEMLQLATFLLTARNAVPATLIKIANRIVQYMRNTHIIITDEEAGVSVEKTIMETWMGEFGGEQGPEEERPDASPYLVTLSSIIASMILTAPRTCVALSGTPCNVAFSFPEEEHQAMFEGWLGTRAIQLAHNGAVGAASYALRKQDPPLIRGYINWVTGWATQEFDEEYRRTGDLYHFLIKVADTPNKIEGILPTGYFQATVPEMRSDLHRHLSLRIAERYDDIARTKVFCNEMDIATPTGQRERSPVKVPAVIINKLETLRLESGAAQGGSVATKARTASWVGRTTPTENPASSDVPSIVIERRQFATSDQSGMRFATPGWTDPGYPAHGFHDTERQYRVDNSGYFSGARYQARDEQREQDVVAKRPRHEERSSARDHQAWGGHYDERNLSMQREERRDNGKSRHEEKEQRYGQKTSRRREEWHQSSHHRQDRVDRRERPGERSRRCEERDRKYDDQKDPFSRGPDCSSEESGHRDKHREADRASRVDGASGEGRNQDRPVPRSKESDGNRSNEGSSGGYRVHDDGRPGTDDRRQ